ncbi:MAG: Mini-ribonuclease 3 [Firmicutes bacterium]|nr:Mini-ribonuclease 3 [Bacillota bacterium]
MKLDNELSEREVKMFSPLQLAYIGDAVYEVYVRKYLLLNTKVKVNGLHKEAIKFVKAKAQANAVRVIKETLTEEEWRVVKRGRNAKSSTVPKNANINDYKYATGFEALIGYLHLTNKDVRIKELFDIIIKDN